MELMNKQGKFPLTTILMNEPKGNYVLLRMQRFICSDEGEEQTNKQINELTNPLI